MLPESPYAMHDARYIPWPDEGDELVRSLCRLRQAWSSMTVRRSDQSRSSCAACDDAAIRRANELPPESTTGKRRQPAVSQVYFRA